MQPLRARETRFAYRSILALLVFVCIYHGLTISYLSFNNFMAPGFKTRMILEAAISIIILSAEATFYWVYRSRLYEKKWIIMHIVLLYIPLMILPVIYGIFTLMVIIHIWSSALMQLQHVAYARMLLFWACIIIGHLFFIATIVKTFLSRKSQQNDGDSPPDLFDGFVD